MEKLIRTICEEICDYPKEVDVKIIDGTKSCIIEVRVNKDDLGKVIGKSGRTANAIRTIIYSASFKYNKRISIEFLSQ